MQKDFQLALQAVMEFELTLRRVARLELMRRHGRRWLSETDALYEKVEPRIKIESKSGLYDSSCSELSYLTLKELSEFIFRQSWNTIFRKVFAGNFGYLSDIQRKINPLRNKIAHFRPIRKEDLFNARGVTDMLQQLRTHYTVSDLTLFHIQSDPCYCDAWVDEGIVSEGCQVLQSFNHDQLWGAVSEGEYLRQYGYSLGLGVFHGHVFVEFFSEFGFPVFELDKFCIKNKENLTFLSLHANKLRVFFSLVNEQRETAKLIRALHRLLGSGYSNMREPQSLVGEVTEHFIGPNMPPTFSFAL
jgi:hypothetical protein